MGDLLLRTLVWRVKSGQYCVIGNVSLHKNHKHVLKLRYESTTVAHLKENRINKKGIDRGRIRFIGRRHEPGVRMTPQNHLLTIFEDHHSKKKKKKKKKEKEKEKKKPNHADPTWEGAESQRSSACTTKLQEWRWRVVYTRWGRGIEEALKMLEEKGWTQQVGLPSWRERKRKRKRKTN
jgi:hypothetical protein